MLGGVHSSTVLKIEEQGASVGSALRKASLGMSKDRAPWQKLLVEQQRVQGRQGLDRGGELSLVRMTAV